MNTKIATKQFRLQYWAGIIKECKASGMKTKDWIIEHNISHDAYYYWLKEVKNAALTNAIETSVSDSQHETRLVEITSPINEISMIGSDDKTNTEVPVRPESLVLHSGNISLDIPLSKASEVLPLLIRELRNA